MQQLVWAQWHDQDPFERSPINTVAKTLHMDPTDVAKVIIPPDATDDDGANMFGHNYDPMGEWIDNEPMPAFVTTLDCPYDIAAKIEEVLLEAGFHAHVDLVFGHRAEKYGHNAAFSEWVRPTEDGMIGGVSLDLSVTIGVIDLDDECGHDHSSDDSLPNWN
jgi:hypothetical protein